MSSCYGYTHLPGYGGHKPETKRNAAKLGKSFGSEGLRENDMHVPVSRSVGIGAHLATEIKATSLPVHEFEYVAARNSARYLHPEGYSGHVPKAPRNQQNYGRSR